MPAADSRRQRRIRRLPRPLTLLAFALVAYFGYHIVDGDRGWLAWQRLQAELVAAEAELARIRAEREQLERRVTHLRTSSLERDLLDERARASLSLIGPDDVIILLDDEDAP